VRILIVGAGLYGAVCAHELTKAGHDCRILEKRDHIGGNVFTRYNDAAQCHEHVYGAHIFHTNNARIWNYVNQFAAFNHYVNRVKVRLKDQIYSFPINLFTLYQIFGVTTPAEAEQRLSQERIGCENPENMEEFCLSAIGQTLYQTFMEGYTCKQWGRHPRDLPVNIVKRLPVRLTHDDNYFDDRFQGVPIGGYTAMVEKMIGDVPVELGVDFLANKDRWEADLIIYSGPIDAYFGYEFGTLEYRALRFEREILPIKDFQGNAVINYGDPDVPFTRIIEHKHFDMNFSANNTIITREYPLQWQRGMTEYYPINDATNNTLYKVYRAEAQKLDGKVHFGGRLGEYAYYDMHQVIGSALAFTERLTKTKVTPKGSLDEGFIA
jgi:UDP-galactopyranose mutase